jgi:hypothetical protein
MKLDIIPQITNPGKRLYLEGPKYGKYNLKDYKNPDIIECNMEGYGDFEKNTLYMSPSYNNPGHIYLFLYSYSVENNEEYRWTMENVDINNLWFEHNKMIFCMYEDNGDNSECVVIFSDNGAKKVAKFFEFNITENTE